MKISFIKYSQENRNYNLAQILGMKVVEINQPEQIDNTIENLKDSGYKTVVISNELASFSENIINKYTQDSKFKIIITPPSKI